MRIGKIWVTMDRLKYVLYPYIGMVLSETHVGSGAQVITLEVGLFASLDTKARCART
jgi:hypothetical protein